MRIVMGLVFMCSLLVSTAKAQDYLEYFTGDSSQILKDINTLLTYRKLGEFKAVEPDLALSYSKNKKDRKRYDSLSKIDSEKYWEWDAYDNARSLAISRLLDEEYYYKQFNNYKLQLIPSIWYDYSHTKGSKNDQTKMLSLLDISQSKKDSILQDKETPLEVRARLGDKEDEQEIINRFNISFNDVESEYFEQQYDLAKRLLYIDTETSLNAFFKMLDSDKTYYYEYKCNRGLCWADAAIAGELLWALSDFYPVDLFRYPPEKLTGKPTWMKYSQKDEEWYLGYTNAQLQPYYREAEKLIKKLYGREVTIDPPYWDRSLGPLLEEW